MTDLLLVIAAIAVVVAGVFAVMPLVVGTLRLAAGYFVAPAPPPPSLTRISAIIEQRLAEQHAASAARQRREPPPAEIVVALRAITGNNRR